eukprot:CAMPEP_0117669728 /NCGR_PEP_ID=MMETSP0804-20121206/12309_1 /TAXON_ID=1074897 /ORGANISM="Tetraselmis astigmatica, Strain CCMP880" /LENGTH=208 /DNA_ID=CAMNT_0005477849 /DNA_START=645 /DNA_END=1271 /DNA_ORIENTATION=-
MPFWRPSSSKPARGEAEETATSGCLQQDAVPQDFPVCWICLDAESRDGDKLSRLCECPNLFAHQLCMAKWQVHKAGTREEQHCRFCDAQLPDWKVQGSSNLPARVTPVMTIVHNGIAANFHPEEGPEGLQHFKEQVMSLLGLSSNTEVRLIFECVEPFTGSRVTFAGPGTYDAAIHCAAVSAARRKIQEAALAGPTGTPEASLEAHIS